MLSSSWLFGTSTILIVVLTCILYYFYYRYSTYWSSRGIPSIRPWPLFGNFLPVAFFKVSAGVHLWNLYKKIDSKIIGIHVFHKPALIIKCPDIIKHMLVKDFKSFSDRYSSTPRNDNLGTHVIFFLKNPKWAEVRRQLSPVFTTAKMKALFCLTNEIGKDLDTHLSNLVKDAGVIEDVREICAKYTTDSIATFAYGVKANCLSNPIAEFRKASKDLFKDGIYRSIELFSIFFIPQIAAFFRFKFFDKTVSELIGNIVTDSIRDRETSGKYRPDYIDALVKIKNSSKTTTGLRYEEDESIGQAANLFAAGFETSSTTISYCLYELALHPNVQNRLRSEIRKTLKECNGELTYDIVVNMTYLDMVLSEAMRKYPSLPFLDRICSSESGYQLPEPYHNVTLSKGTPIYIPTIALHMDPQYFPNPDHFDPERFTKEAKLERPAYCYLPFGSGPHACVGERFGSYQSKTGLLYFLKNHRVEVCEKTVIPATFNARTFVLTPNEPLMLKIERID